MIEEEIGNGVAELPPVSLTEAAEVSRYPQELPTLGRVLGPLIAGAISGSLGLWFFAAFVPRLLRQDGVALDGPIGAIVGLLSVSFLVLLLWVVVQLLNGAVRRRAWVCYMVNSRSLAICVPGRPTVYVKRRDCVRCYPRRNQLVLRDGRTANLGLLKKLGSVWAPLCERWWPDVWAAQQANITRDYIHDLLHVDVLAAGVLWVLLCVLGVFLGRQLGLALDTEAGSLQSLMVSAPAAAVGVVAGVGLYRWRRRRYVVELGERAGPEEN